MSNAWQSYPGAPVPGTRICHLDDVADAGLLPVEIGGFGLLVLRQARDVRAFVNACPHQYLPLDYRSGSILSADGARLICSNHEANFDAVTGEGLGGLVQGCNLDMVPVTLDRKDDILVGET